MADRLDVFGSAQVDKIRTRMGAFEVGPWPPLAGCLALLFTARSGSTYLCRELECQLDTGRMRESLNPPPFEGLSAVQRAAERQDRWFACKTSSPGVIAGELNGFFDANLDRTSFLLLARRDIVAQAVSREKAAQTGKWHAIDTAAQAASYDGEKIAKAIRVIASTFEQLRLYAEVAGRPWQMVFYEDFAEGDFTTVLQACAAFGVPPANPDSMSAPRRVERAGDEINETWIARFQAETPPGAEDVIERYQAALLASGSAPRLAEFAARR